jgi:penicillin-binding protein 1A
VGRQEQVAAKRSELLDAIRRGFDALGGRVFQRGEGEDMVVEQGGPD